MNQKAEDIAFGRWPEILMRRGMDPNFFTGKAGPCPFCPDGGGRDRFRFVKSKYGGVWVCSACTGSKYASGMNMLMKHMDYSFREAADDVREFFGTNDDVKPISREQRLVLAEGMTPEKKRKNLARMKRTWSQCRELVDSDPVMRYLRKRVPGLDFVPANIRYHPALEYWLPPEKEGGQFTLLGKFHAMVAYAQGPDGEMVQLHKTYLTQDGDKADVPVAKKTDLGVGVNSFAIRMLDIYGDTLGIGEGIETCAAGGMMRDIPVWPCLNGPAMAAFVLPEEYRGVVKKLVIFEDHDELKAFGRNADGSVKYRRPGSVYSQQAAESARRQGLKVLIMKSAKVGNDFADHWQQQVAA